MKKWEQQTVNRWFADKGNELLRLGHDLNEDSIVFDIGGFTGEGAQRIWDKYNCNIYTFEPLEEFYNVLEERFRGNEKVKTFPFGLGVKAGLTFMNAEGDAASMINGGDREVRVEDIYHFFIENNIYNVDLMEINIEGAEFDLLDYMLDVGLHLLIDNIQIQFHDVIPDAYDRMTSIQGRLSETHELTYQYLFCFENWKLKNV